MDSWYLSLFFYNKNDNVDVFWDKVNIVLSKSILLNQKLN